MTNPDGSIYSLPQINSGAELRVSRKIFINKDWLEKSDKEIPSTTEELYELLKTFREQDMNGNGDPNDEIPLCTQDWLSIYESFCGSFGLGNRGLHNLTVDCDEFNDGVRLIAATGGYKDFLEYFNKLYSEGILDKYVFTSSTEQWANNIENDRVGVFVNTDPATVPTGKSDNWIAIGEALEGPNGYKLCSAVRANFHSTGAAVIPSTCKNPELVLRWLDYFRTDAGTLFYHMGVENETFIAKEDGTYDYMPYIYDEMKSKNKSFDDIVAEYSPYPGGSNPTVEIAPYFMGGEMAEIPAAARSLIIYGPEENERLNVILTDIKKYCDATQVDFITGATPFSEWESYLNQLDKLGKNDLLTIYQAAVDRYKSLKSQQSITE